MRLRRPSNDHRIPSAANAAIVAGQLAAIAGCCCWASHARQFWSVAGLALTFGVLMNSVYSIIHEAEHAMLFRSRPMNEAAGVVMALFFPAPFHLLRQGHIGHHLRNRSDDEAFDLYFEGDNVIWRWMVWLGILTGFYYLLVVLSNVIAVAAPFIFDRRNYLVVRAARPCLPELNTRASRPCHSSGIKIDRASAAFIESFNPAYLRWIRLEGLSAILLHVAIVLIFRIPLWNYLAMYGGFGFMWSAMQYVHHYRTERHVTRGARNLWIFGPVDAIWLNHIWHRTHHEHPTVPWIHLPAIADVGTDGRAFLPWAYLGMWRGPRRTEERVENKYAGRIIQ